MKRTLAVLLLSALLTGSALAADDVPTQDEAMALLKDGKREEALKAFERIAASHPPDPAFALFQTANIALALDRWRDAKPYVRQLVKLRPGSMQAWELLVQVDQAAGDKADQKDAMDRMYSAWRNALDPAIHQRVSFIRDRVFGPRHTLIVQQTLDTGGDEIVRWIFQPDDEIGKASHYLIVRSDEQTNERWREAGTVSFGTVVYHLDAVTVLPNGQARVVPYEFYLDEPDYDRVRKMAVDILTGKAKPLSGDADPFWTSDSAKP